MESNRKVATGLRLINWSRFSNVYIKFDGSTLITGNNGVGKSTVLDAFLYVLTGNTSFNIAAKDKDRSVIAYVKGDTKSEGPDRYLRGNSDVISYIAMEFYSPIEEANMVVMVALELKKDDSKVNSGWYVARDTALKDIKFCEEKDGATTVFPKNQITIKGHRVNSSEYLAVEKGTKKVLQAMGLRCSVKQYKDKLLKMMSFDPQRNIDKFIQEFVLEPSELSTLDDLREQKANYDAIKAAYDDMLESKKILEEIESRTSEYEQTNNDYNKRNLILLYQNQKKIESAIESINSKRGSAEAHLTYLYEERDKKEKEVEAARKTYEELSNDKDVTDIKRNLERYENKVKKLAEEKNQLSEAVSKIKTLQEWIVKILEKYEAEIPDSVRLHETLSALSVEGNTEEKIKAFYAFSESIKNLTEQRRTDRARNTIFGEDSRNELSAKLESKKQLESNRLVYGQGYEQTKKFIISELEKRGIKTEVKYFVELINDVKDKKWRKAIETFLNKKRFDIIIDPKYVSDVLNIVNENPAHEGRVVMTDRLKETAIEPSSAAEQLDIINPYARMYANYLLNGIHLCETIKELHEYPKGAIMPNGMLAKSYAFVKMNINTTKLYVGADAIKIQIAELDKEIDKLKTLISTSDAKDKLIEQEINELQRRTLNQDLYDFNSANRIASVNEELRSAIAERDSYSKDSNITVLLLEENKAKEKWQKLTKDKDKYVEQIGSTKTEIDKYKQEIESRQIALKEAEDKFNQECKDKLELKQPAIDMYNQLVQRKEAAITEKTVKEWQHNLELSIKKLEDAHLIYCKINNLDTLRRGVQFIGFYRDAYRNLANVQIEEAKQKLEKQDERLQSAFVGDFIAGLNELIRSAKDEIDRTNDELKARPFGNDIYQFKHNDRVDSEGKRLFFSISKKMQKYIDNPEYYLNEIKDDEESERELKEFINIVLQEEDETEYTDYRKYCTYDMTIDSKQGENRVRSVLSKKQGSASNGEKQTPYFIILAASLLQLYPKDRSSARLIFIDEAFAALSRERIEQMVDYLESNDFQVVYAAPPDKIDSIGTHVKSNITLVEKGRYTFAIEGLEKHREI